MRLATIDIGTNTALLLVADVAGGQVRPVHEAQRFVRLGEGVDASRVIRPEAMARLRRVLLDYRDEARALGAETVVVAGTSASRDARNRADLVAFVRDETGLDYEVLSGEEEARWTFAGALSAFPDLPSPCLMLDVGGGSTEIVLGEPGGGEPVMRYRRSLDIGSVRLMERCFSTQPPAPEEVAEAESIVRAAFEGADVPTGRANAFVGAAGTATALALVHTGTASWETLGERDVVLTRAEVRAWRSHLLRRSFDEVMALNPAVMEGRADVFPAGVLILDLFMDHAALPACRVSPRGLRHGLAMRHLGGGGAGSGG